MPATKQSDHDRLETALKEIRSSVKGAFIKWGYQEYSTIMLSVVETAGELARAIMLYEFGNGNAGEIRKYALQLADLCIFIMINFYLHGK